MAESLTQLFLARHMRTESEPVKPPVCNDPSLSNSLTVTSLHTLKPAMAPRARLLVQPATVSRPVSKPKSHTTMISLPSVSPLLFQRGLQSAQGRFSICKPRVSTETLYCYKTARRGGFPYPLRLSTELSRKRSFAGIQNAFRGQVTGKRLLTSQSRGQSWLVTSLS